MKRVYRMPSVRIARLLCLFGVVFIASSLGAQPPTNEPVAVPEIPEIADEPKTVDPAGLVPDAIAARATVQFEDSSLRELVDWLRSQNLVVLLDNRALNDEGISLGEPVSDRLDNAPIYFLLNRLRSLQLSWYFDDGILHITTASAIDERQLTKPYNVGDLLDNGYDADSLYSVITSGVSVDTWEEAGGPGSVELLGDVLFVRQSDAQHFEVQGLLSGLRKHGRRTLTLDPPEHLALRAKMSGNVTVDFNDTPLETAVSQLATQAAADMRLDRHALRSIRVRDREPVTLNLADRSLETVLHVMLSDLELTWVLRDGVLWITSQEAADEELKTAVYDVRDLCRNGEESQALEMAIVNQTAPNWEEVGGVGTITFPKPGTMVVRQTERSLDEVLQLLETYRTALRASKPRDRSADERKEVVTRYYQLQAQIAEDLETQLPQLIAADSWKSDDHADRVGTILRIASTTRKMEEMTVEHAVLVIRQTKGAHEQIALVLERIKNGDPQFEKGNGFGGGGFGGGFFNVPNGRSQR